MMKMFKSLLRVALAFALVAAPLSVAVPVFAESQNSSPVQGGNFGGLHENLDFYGVKPCRITASTTAVLCKSGEGFLDAVCASGGAAANYSLAVDSGIAGSRSVTNSDTLVLTPMVFAKADTGGLDIKDSLKCWSAKSQAGGPVKFVNGLVGVQSAATHTTLLYWHYSNGENP